MTQVFISYSRKDLTFVEKLASDLKGAGFEVWYDLSSLEGGERWRAEIQNAIKSSQYFMVVLSPDSVASVWVEREFMFSSNLKQKIVPLLYRECELPLNYLDLNMIDVQGENYQRNFPRILKALNVPAATSTSANPPSINKSSDSKKTIIVVGIIVTFFCVLLSLAIIFLIDKNFHQVSATPIPTIASPVPTASLVVDTPVSLSEIDQKYSALGGDGGILGAPAEPEQSTVDGKGRFRNFQNGVIYWDPDTGTHEVHGAILEKWNELGRDLGILGYPMTDETPTSDGVGRYNDFQGGTIYWSPDTGVHEVHGAILGKWNELGRETGLGYPMTDETPTSDGIGRYNDFQGGSIYWSPNTGVHEVHGVILAKWNELGREKSCLGYPISDEEASSGDWERQSRFERGVIKWSSEKGAVEFCY